MDMGNSEIFPETLVLSWWLCGSKFLFFKGFFKINFKIWRYEYVLSVSGKLTSAYSSKITCEFWERSREQLSKHAAKRGCHSDRMLRIPLEVDEFSVLTRFPWDCGCGTPRGVEEKTEIMLGDI